MAPDPGSALLYAHALVAREDLPIPAWLFAWGASIVLIVSFFVLTIAWREPRFEENRFRPLGSSLSRLALGLPTQVICGLIGVFLLWLTIYAGLRGTDAPDRNFALTFVFVTVWLGFPVLSVLLGDVFRAFNPWRAVGRAAGWAFASLVGQAPAHARYPQWLGRWPAAIGLAAFVWLEIVYGTSGGVSVGLSPETTAIATLAYSGYTLAMMVLFGTEEWCRRGGRSSPSTSACSPSWRRSRCATNGSAGAGHCPGRRAGQRCRVRLRWSSPRSAPPASTAPRRGRFRERSRTPSTAWSTPGSD
jgi:hypothetical protein